MNCSVVVVGTVGIPASYGGFESLVENLTLYKSSHVKYTVICSSKAYKARAKTHNEAELVYVPLKANGIQSIAYDVFSLILCIIRKPNVVLILGVSGCLFLPFFKMLCRSKVVTNIDGLEWKREKWGKFSRRFLKWSESFAVKYSDVVITDNQAITDYVNKEYSIESKTIAYGGDHAIRNLTVPSSNERYALGLCRIEPENNVAMILEAYSNTNENLVFVGNWQASEFGRNIKNQYSAFKNIKLLEPIYDLDELYKLRRGCSLYLHGHSAGGTNPSLVEMMHFGVPILAFDCSFNRQSTDNKACFFESSEDLVSILSSIQAEVLAQNAIKMKEIANKRYIWNKITQSYEKTYC
nr:glycosyl transferase [Vibrio breoganii]